MTAAEKLGRFTGTSATNIPAGALIFYANRHGIRDLSHVVIATGNGTSISSADAIKEWFIHSETIAQHSCAIFQGWSLP